MEKGVERYIENIHNHTENLLQIINMHHSESMAAFVLNNNLDEFIKDLKTLQPYLNSKHFEKMPGFKGLVAGYDENIMVLKKTIRQAYYINFKLWEKDFNYIESGATVNELIIPLRNIRDNTGNQLYQIKINR